MNINVLVLNFSIITIILFYFLSDYVCAFIIVCLRVALLSSNQHDTSTKLSTHSFVLPHGECFVCLSLHVCQSVELCFSTLFMIRVGCQAIFIMGLANDNGHADAPNRIYKDDGIMVG